MSGGASSAEAPFWERPEVVERFASREPDHRLAAWVDRYARPSSIRVLDLGCAGGRNTVFLWRRGFDVVARDASPAMVEATRRRLASGMGEDEAARRVRVGFMDRLGDLGAGSIDLVVALGVFHEARSEGEFHRALAEAARILTCGGVLLAACFTPETDPDGRGAAPVPGEPHLFEGMGSGRVHLVSAPALEREMAAHGLVPLIRTETVSRDAEGGGRRVTANGLYVRR
jgi:SAM-dependent methyltransferase